MRISIHYIYILLSIILLSTPLYASTDKIAKQRSLIATLEKQIAGSEQEVAKLRRDRAANEVTVKKLASQIETRNRLLSAQQAEVAVLRGEISTADLNISSLSKQLGEERVYYSQMVREAYRSYSSHNTLTYLFTATDFQDMARRVANLRAVSQMRERRIERVDSLTKAIGSQRDQLVERKGELDRVVADLKRQKQSLESDQRSARASISKMSAKEREVLKQSVLQQKQRASAIKELQKLIKDNEAGASFTTKIRGLKLPVQGGRVKQYKDNMAEIVGLKGAKISAVYEGKVVDVRRNRITGKYDVYIAHGEYITSYAGLSEVSVAKDALVLRDSVIGVIGEAVDIITMQSEHKIVFGVYPPTSNVTMKASTIFSK